MATFGTYYLNAPSLASATSAYTDAALTTLAPDGVYSDGTSFRELVSGVFLDFVATCPACAAPCDSSTPININDTGAKTYYVQKDLGSTILDTGAVIVEITFNGDEYPLGIVFMYNGINYNTFSSSNAGKVSIISTSNPEFIYIGRQLYDCGIVGNSYNANNYTYDPVNNTFVNFGTSSIISPDASQYGLSFPAPGKYVMVIPKTNATVNILEYIASVLCPSALNVDILVKCPDSLPFLTSTEVCASYTDTCLLPTIQTYYSADVNGNTLLGGFLGLYDWVFYDSFGQSLLANGWYRSPSCPSPYTSFEVQDGVIIGFDSCGSVVQRNINYEVQNSITGACAANVNDLRLKISQPPVSPYADSSAYATGTVIVPEGLTHIQLILDWTNIVSGCGQLRMIVEKDGSIIASKTFPASTGIEYLDVDFTLNADCNIYAYATLL